MRVFTEEERKAGQEKRKKKVEEWKAYAEEHHEDFGDDMKWWEAAAREIGFRLPPNYVPNTETKYYRKFLKHTGKDIHWWRDVTGCATIEAYAKMNPTWSCKALIGTLFEAIKEENSDAR